MATPQTSASAPAKAQEAKSEPETPPKITSENAKWVLATKVVGIPKQSNFELKSLDVPVPEEGKLLLKSLFVSVDPYLRGTLRVGESTVSGTVAEVVTVGGGEAKSSYKKGDLVFCYLPWSIYNVVPAAHPVLTKVSAGDGAPPPSTALGVMGMPGRTAYFGLHRICKPKAGETVLVTGAAGAVGSMVGQLAKKAGCFVVGTCGSPEKVAYVKSLGFDAVLNYKDYSTWQECKQALQGVCPKKDGVPDEGRIDCFFDNTGGPMSDGAFFLMRKFARVAICGQIAHYNATDVATGPRILAQLIYKSVTVRGFVQNEWSTPADFKEFNDAVAPLVTGGNLKYQETVVNGFEQIPLAFKALFTGKNTGKMVVKL